MKNKYHRLSVGFYFVSSLLLGLAFAKIAAAVGFSALNVSPCATSGGFDSGGFCSDIGIDYSQLTGNLVTSTHFDTGGSPNSLDNVDRITGARVPLASFATIGEVKVATVRQVQGGCTQQWPVGTVFAGNGTPGQIVKIDPDGTITNPWRDLSAFGETAVLTGLFHDRWCVSGGDLIVVSGSDDGMTGGNVWRVSESADPVFLNDILKPGIPQDCGPGGVSSPLRRRSDEPVLMAGIDPRRLLPGEMGSAVPTSTVSLSDVPMPMERIWWEALQRRNQKTHVRLASLLAQSTPCVSANLKGVITVPNDSKYGPWAGMIVTGDDDQIITSTGYVNGTNPKIYSVRPDTGDCDQNTSSLNSQSCFATITVKDATGATGKALPHPEDFDFIEGDFYGVSYLNSSASGLPGQILSAPSTDFPAQTGSFPDILITQEYPVDQPNILSGSPVSIGGNSGLYTVQWNASASAFVTTQLPRSGGPEYTQWEHVTFAPPVPALKVEKHPKQGELVSTFNQGAQVSFTIVVSNPGTATATNVQLSDALPSNSGLVWQTASTTQGTCTNPIVGNTLNCSLGNIAPGALVTVTVTSTATTPVAACQDQPNPAAIATSGNVTAQDSGFLTCTPAAAPTHLKVEKHPKQGEANSVFTQGSQVSFTIVVSNPGSSGDPTATGVQLTDTLPGNGGLVWQSATTTPQGSCTNPIIANALNCSLGDIAPGGSVMVTVTSTANTPAAACQDQPNPAAIATSGNVTAKDSGFLTCSPPAQAQLFVVKSPKNGTFTQGSQVSFTIVVSNPAAAGSQSATNVQLTDILPGSGGLVWDSATANQGSCTSPIVGNILSCSLGTIAAGASATVTVLSTATTPPAACTSQPNPVALATADGNLRAQDNGSLVCTPPPAQLAVVKSPHNGTFTQGSQVSFTMVVSNPAPAGAQSATNVQLTDTLPANGGLSWATATSSQGSCTLSGTNNSNLSCSLGAIAPQGSLTVTVTSTATTPLAACTSQPNPVALATADGGLRATDNGSLTCTPPAAQLAIVKSPKNGTFTQGSQVSFTMVVSNPAPAGAQSATNVQLTDTLPTNGGLSWATATATQGSCTLSGTNNSNLSCSLGTIAPQGSLTITVTSINPTPLGACQSQPNPAALATADGGLKAQDSGSLSCTPPAAQLAVVKTPKNGTFAQGSQVSFTIVVSNPAPAGAQAASNVQLTDALPGAGGLVWQNATTTQGSCVNPIVGNALNCSLGNIAPGGSVTVTITSPATTPTAACQNQPNPAAIATSGSMTAQDSGFLTCTPPPAPWCEKQPVQTELSPAGPRFPGNAGPDVIVKVHLGQSLQAALDSAADINGDGYIIVAVVAKDGGLLGGTVTQSVVINRTFTKPFGLIGCSVTLHDPTPSDSQPTGRILSTSSAPADGAGATIFVMDLHTEGSNFVGWLVEGNGRELRNVYGNNNAIGIKFVGNSNTMHNGAVQNNTGAGLVVQGNSNLVTDTDVFGNGGNGVDVTGNSNQILKVDAGDIGKGNGGDGIHVSGYGNVLQENDAFVNGGDGIEVIATSGAPNVLKKNVAGDRGKGNAGNGIVVSGNGNGTSNPIELEENTAKANTLMGIKVTGTGHQLKNNVSGGSGSGETNGSCEFNVVAGNFNATGNKANGTTISGSNGSAFPTGCIGN